MPDAFLKRVIAQREAEREAGMSGPGLSLPRGKGDPGAAPEAHASASALGVHCMDDLVEDLYSDTQSIRAGTLSTEKASAISSVVNRLIGMAKVQIAYAVAREELPDIPFLNRKSR